MHYSRLRLWIGYFIFFKFTLVSFSSLQILNSVVDKFYWWDSRNKTLIAPYEEKIETTTICVLFWETNISLRIYQT